VQGSNSDGAWNEAGVSLPIVITPPWWKLNERTRIARELHDNLLQTVQGFILRLQSVIETMPVGAIKNELEQTLDIGDRAILEGRQAVQDLRSASNTKDLAQAVQHCWRGATKCLHSRVCIPYRNGNWL
jgi:signal transduction histidine kinase